MHALSVFFHNVVAHYGYGGLFVAMTLANIGMPVGSEVILPGAGVLVGRHMLSNVWLTIGVAVAAELFGQSIGYAIGRFGGRPLVERFGGVIHFSHRELDRVHGFFTRYGNVAIFLCRFIPVIRGIVGIAAGIAEMPLAPFYLWTFLGSTIFCGAFVYAGYALGEHADAFTHSFGRIALIVAGVIIVGIVVYAFLLRRNRSAAEGG